MFPQAPNITGGTPSVQIIVALTFMFATIVAAWLGYRGRVEREPSGAAATVVAAFPDMTAVRQLTDQCRVLCGHVESLDATIREMTHHIRNGTETNNEVCQRLRELKEEIVRSDIQRSRRARQQVSPPKGS